MNKSFSVKGKLGQVLFSHEQILKKIQIYADQLNQNYKGQKLTIIGILNGAAYFIVHLSYLLEFDFELDFIAVASYQKNQQNKTIQFYKKTKLSLKNKNILIIEDIVDGGHTRKKIIDFVQTQNPKTLRFCSLISYQKKTPQDSFISEYLFFVSSRQTWLVGFGFDYNESFRNLRDIHKFTPLPNKKK